MTMCEKRLSAEYQREVGNFVHRNILTCISHLVSEVAPKFMEEGEYQDECMTLLYPAREFVAVGPDGAESEEFSDETDAQEWIDEEQADYYIALDINGDPLSDADGEVIRFELDAEARAADGAEDWDIIAPSDNWMVEEREREIFEHWAVDPWFGARLKERGETVEDFFGLTTWGRTCTGQAIALDNVICDIYDAVVAERESWKEEK